MFFKNSFLFIGVIVVSFTLFCGKKNPVNSNEYGALFIRTENEIYEWQYGDDEIKKRIVIQGVLENISGNIYYSKVGDGFNAADEQDPLHIADNSAGYLEKYDEKNNSWNEVKLLGFLIEGSRYISMKPSKTYTIHAYLSIGLDKEEKGIYRFRIDYYNKGNPDDTVVPFSDYSNTFRIIDIIKK